MADLLSEARVLNLPTLADLPQTALAVKNFALNFHPVNRALILAIIEIKKAAALTYAEIAREKSESQTAEIHAAIAAAAEKFLTGELTDSFPDCFPTDALQGGAGTSTHQNVNEVLAFVANSIYADARNWQIHPLDQVNRGQSTNDVYPTALRIAAIRELRQVSEHCAALQTSLQLRENESGEIKKIGRTELMDAVPVTLGAAFGAFAQAIARDRWRLYKIEERLRQVNLGGTAVGGADNAERQYRFRVIEKLRAQTGIGLAAAEYPLDITQNNDVFVEVSGLLKALAVNLLKIAGDLRLMNMNAIREIELAELQMGSTIMPGKVNPVGAEMLMQVAMKIIANDGALTLAAARGEFELNAFMPLIADSLLESLSLLNHALPLFREQTIDRLTVNNDRCAELLRNSLAFATAFVPQLGYDRVAEIIKNGHCDPERARAELSIAQAEKNKSS